MGKHARFSPSAAHRWLACPGCVAFCEQHNRVSKSSKYAAEGKAAHALAEQCISLECAAADMIDTEIEGYTVTESMAEAVQVYIDLVEGVSAKASDVRIEQRIEFMDTSGTADCIVYHDDAKTLVVVDYKHGVGIAVSPHGNPQLRIYALGALALFPEAERVRIVIVQPRAQGETIKEEWVDAEDLRTWGKTVLAPGLSNAKSASVKNVYAGEHCRFCPGLPICPAQKQRALDVAKVEFSAEPIFLPVEALTDDEIAQVLAFTSQFEAWKKAVVAYAQEIAEQGTRIPGWKLVEKRALRKWKPDTQGRVEEILKEGAWKKSLVSPAEAEKRLKKLGIEPGTIGDLWEKPKPGLTLAPESDKRKEIELRPGEEFVEVLDIFE